MRSRVGVLALMALVSAACGKIQEVNTDAAPQADAAPSFDANRAGPCDPGGNPNPGEAYDCLVRATCELVTRCFIPYTVEQCMTLDLEVFDIGIHVHRELVAEAIAEGRIELQADEVAACAQTVREQECTFLFERALSDFSLDDVCPAVFTGTVAADDPCETRLECANPGATCGRPDECGDGGFCCAATCLDPVADDASCATAPCQPGSYCVAGTCRSGAEDAMCNGTRTCDPGLWCNAGVCVPEVASGAPCTESEECSGPEVCVVPPGATAGTCGRVDQVDAPCEGSCMGLECVQPDPDALGSCQPYLAEAGADCTDRECLPAFDCPAETSECTPRGDPGDPCTGLFGECNFGLFCDTEVTGEPAGQCTGRQADGERCSDDDQCVSGVCGGTAGAETCRPYPGCYE